MEQRTDVKPPDRPSAVKVGDQHQDQQSTLEGSVKETIESILVAFILAFIFRAFVVEAFVIPTGSMAPTLLGAHMRFRCSDCGYRFEVNFPTAGGDDINIPARASPATPYPIICPNCGFRLPADNAEDRENQTKDPAVHYGDRILVLKYLYLLQEPQRWDVVVFKAPVDPARHDYSQNYIKRLVGKPGETVMILDGDVYVAGGTGADLRPDAFAVQTKPRHVQDALWRIVYDNDYHPRGLPRLDARGNLATAFQQPWKPAAPGQQSAGWTIGDGSPGNRSFEFDNLTGAGALRFDPEAIPGSNALTDWVAYDVNELSLGDNNVSDVKLGFHYQRRGGDGALRVELTKLRHTFGAEIAPDGVTLLMDGRPIAGPVSVPSHTSKPLHVEVMNVDYRVSVWIDGKEVLATTPKQYAPDVRTLLEQMNQRQPKPQVRIIAEKQTCTLSHVSLYRDVYYLNRARPGSRDQIRWATPESFPKGLISLGPEEYFVLGDNSLVSLDARFWEEPINLDHESLHVQSGRVPGRFMLGKAFFVYWPAGFRPAELPYAIVPNFGDMRFIH